MTGLLNAPNADMQPDGMFMAGGNFLPEQLMPETWHYNSGNYFLNITFFPFVEVAYRCTLFRGEYKAGNKWQQDRSVSLRLRPVRESRYVPAVVVGSNDVFTTNELNAFNGTNGNRYFASIYAVTTKNIPVGGHVCGITFGSYLFSKNALYKGVFCGIKYTPSFLKPVSLIAEYDANGVNVGTSARLFKHVFLHAFSYDFKALSCGMRYEFRLMN
ncbi:MAG: YjbH domain-containing protein [Tannerella sp.]|jgi:hypothetical protein|nr:YjbH domain-containing protein [Tannerella sp.]